MARSPGIVTWTARASSTSGAEPGPSVDVGPVPDQESLHRPGRRRTDGHRLIEPDVAITPWLLAGLLDAGTGHLAWRRRDRHPGGRQRRRATIPRPCTAGISPRERGRSLRGLPTSTTAAQRDLGRVPARPATTPTPSSWTGASAPNQQIRWYLDGCSHSHRGGRRGAGTRPWTTASRSSSTWPSRVHRTHRSTAMIPVGPSSSGRDPPDSAASKCLQKMISTG